MKIVSTADYTVENYTLFFAPKKLVISLVYYRENIKIVVNFHAYLNENMCSKKFFNYNTLSPYKEIYYHAWSQKTESINDNRLHYHLCKKPYYESFFENGNLKQQNWYIDIRYKKFTYNPTKILYDIDGKIIDINYLFDENNILKPDIINWFNENNIKFINGEFPEEHKTEFKLLFG